MGKDNVDNLISQMKGLSAEKLTGDPNQERVHEIILEQSELAGEIRSELRAQSKEEGQTLRVAGTRNVELRERLAKRGIILRDSSKD